MHTHIMHTETTKFRTASYILMAAALLVILYFRFLPLLLSIILTYIFINRTNGLILWMRHRLLPQNTFLHRSLNVRNINLDGAGRVPPDSQRAHHGDAGQTRRHSGQHQK